MDVRATIFVAKIPSKAKAREVWDFFKRAGKVLDIILPRKRDVNGNRIGFVKVDTDKVARGIMEKVGSKKLLGSKLDLKLVLNKSKNRESSERENFFKGKNSSVRINTDCHKLKSAVKAPKSSTTNFKHGGTDNSISLSSNLHSYSVNL